MAVSVAVGMPADRRGGSNKIPGSLGIEGEKRLLPRLRTANPRVYMRERDQRPLYLSRRAE